MESLQLTQPDNILVNSCCMMARSPIVPQPLTMQELQCGTLVGGYFRYIMWSVGGFTLNWLDLGKQIHSVCFSTTQTATTLHVTGRDGTPLLVPEPTLYDILGIYYIPSIPSICNYIMCWLI